MEPREGRTTSADGRSVAYLDGGDPVGAPVIGLHGTPGCRWSRWPDDGLYARAGVRYVTTDRAGYGRSDRHPGRRVVDEVADVLAVADTLGLDRFAVVGGSGGGPHALACAARPAGRVARVACQSSIAPVGPGGMTLAQYAAGMAPEMADELRWAGAGEAVVREHREAAQADMERAVAEDPADLLGASAPDSDRAALGRDDVLQRWRLIVAEQAVHGVWGSVDDTLAFARPWGFDLGDIAVPVLLTHGAQDTSAPLAHGEFLAARIPGVRFEIDAEGGHLPREPEAEITATMRWLAGG